MLKKNDIYPNGIILQSASQQRVKHTVAIIAGVLTGLPAPNQIEENKFLGQDILGKSVGEFIVQKINEISTGDSVAAQNKVIQMYLNGEMEREFAPATPLIAAREGMCHFKDMIIKLNVPYIKRTLSISGQTMMKPGDIVSSFFLVRHGHKGADGNLSSTGIEEAQMAGEKLKDQGVSGDIFGVQQPTNQMIMMCLIAGRNGSLSTEQAWNSLPEAWKEPYRTGEVTRYDIVLNTDFDCSVYDSCPTKSSKEHILTDNEYHLYSPKTAYILQHLLINVTRNNHTQAFTIDDITKYQDLLESYFIGLMRENEDLTRELYNR